MINHTLVNKKAIDESVKHIRHTTTFKPQLALILGSGLNNVIKIINIVSCINSTNVPNYPVPSVQGHAGNLIFGYLQKDYLRSVPLLIFQGRVHFYENESIESVIYPIVLAHSLGIRKLIITNAAGGINDYLVIGDLMLIVDILNFTFMKYFLPKDVIFNNWFNNNLQQIALRCASQLSIPLHKGTYCWLKGPSYETPAEIQMLKRIGVDAVGMSTMPEILIASILKMNTLAISLISNMAAGISKVKLSHDEITKTAASVNNKFIKLIENIILSSV